jgi:2-polyprenyl-6-methoxyphenol hydroxylase-like FAD-dependent oxidoreductase
LDTIDQAPDFYFHVIQQIKMSKWSNSRIVCVGDAAYCPSSLAGGGTTLAIIGAYVLAGELSKLNNGEDPSKAFKAYESTLRPHVEIIQQIPSSIVSIAHPDTAWKRWLLKCFLSAFSKVIVIFPALVNGSRKKNDDGFQLPHYSIFEEG